STRGSNSDRAPATTASAVIGELHDPKLPVCLLATAASCTPLVTTIVRRHGGAGKRRLRVPFESLAGICCGGLLAYCRDQLSEQQHSLRLALSFCRLCKLDDLGPFCFFTVDIHGVLLKGARISNGTVRCYPLFHLFRTKGLFQCLAEFFEHWVRRPLRATNRGGCCVAVRIRYLGMVWGR